MSKVYDDINQETNVATVASVGLDLHPDMLLEAGKVLATDDAPMTTSAYKSARQAQALLHNAMGLIEDAYKTTSEAHSERLVVDGRQIRGEIPDARKVELANAMSDAFTQVAHKFDNHLGTVTDVVEKLDSSIKQALAPPKETVATATQAAQLRSIVGMQSDPMGYLMGALKDDDREVVHAVLSTSPRASGLTKEQHNTLREMAAEAFAPRETAQFKAASQVRAALLRSAQVFTTRYQKLLPVVTTTPATAAREKLKGAAA